MVLILEDEGMLASPLFLTMVTVGLGIHELWRDRLCPNGMGLRLATLMMQDTDDFPPIHQRGWTEGEGNSVSRGKTADFLTREFWRINSQVVCLASELCDCFLYFSQGPFIHCR